jgi:amino acid permease
MILQSHLISMIVYALLVALVMAFLRREGTKARLRYGVTLFLIMVGGALAFGWFMFLFVKK